MIRQFSSIGMLTVFLATQVVAQTVDENQDVTAEKIVVIVAHPDDELAFAPAIHAYARLGHPVTLVFTTEGDQGPGVSGLERGDALAKVRMAEATCSQDALGALKLVSLDLGDGRLGIEARLKDSAANRLLAQVPELIDGAKTVITFGPEGGYGHSDHRITGAVVAQYIQSLEPSERPLLLYPAIIHGPLPPQLVEQGWTLTARDLASTGIRYTEDDLAAASAAAQCYKTQFDAATRAIIAPGFDQFVWKGEVSFRPAF